MHPEDIKQEAKIKFEKQHGSPGEISAFLKVPISTVYYWINKEGWTKQEETPENIALQEFKRLSAKPRYSKDDLNKMKALRVILDEYAESRSLLALEIENTVSAHRANSATDKNAVLNDLVKTLNRHAGATLKQLKDSTKTAKTNDFRGVLNAE